MNADSIRTVAVLGLGTMGHGIAQCFAAAGCKVQCFDEVAAVRQALPDRVRGNLERMAEAGLVEPAGIAPILDRLVLCDTVAAALAAADFVTEAIREELGAKQALFAHVESLVKPGAILASNSSSYPITHMAERMRHPERAIVTHWFNPPHIVPVVEVVPGQKTAPSTTQATLALLKRLGKTAIHIRKEIPGFLVNRVQIAMLREVYDLLERGIASAEEIDSAIQGSMGLRLAALGPLQITDFAGHDIGDKVYCNLVGDLRSDAARPPILRKMIDAGQYGAKTGQGFFTYSPESLQQKQAERDRRYLALVKLLHCDPQSE